MKPLIFLFLFCWSLGAVAYDSPAEADAGLQKLLNALQALQNTPGRNPQDNEEIQMFIEPLKAEHRLKLEKAYGSQRSPEQIQQDRETVARFHREYDAWLLAHGRANNIAMLNHSRPLTREERENLELNLTSEQKKLIENLKRGTPDDQQESERLLYMWAAQKGIIATVDSKEGGQQ